jgi:hypothetical protein
MKVAASTFFSLMAEFGTAQIPLDDMCDKYFDLTLPSAKRKAAAQDLPVPAIKLRDKGHTKYFIKAEHLADMIDQQAELAMEDWRAVNE